MPLYIRDEEVNSLVEKVMKLTKAPNKTEVVRRAMLRELERDRQSTPLLEQVNQIRQRIKARMGNNRVEFDQKKFTDEMWEL